MFKRILVMLLFLAPTNVFAFGINSTMEDVMGSWMGESLDAVVTQWGYPADEKNIAGKKLYFWYRNMNLYTPVTTTGAVNQIGNTSYVNMMSYGGYQGNMSCTRILEVDESNRVVGYQWEGNNCPFAKRGPYRNWENKNKGKGYSGTPPKL